MAQKKLIAVMGATGCQGGAVVDALLKCSDQFDIRAITRNPDSKAAKALAEKGIELFKADADNEDSMIAAFTGAYGAFLVTDFWSDMDMKHEIEQTKILNRAVIAADVKHVVLSTLEDSRPLIQKASDVDTWPIVDKEFQSYGKAVFFILLFKSLRTSRLFFYLLAYCTGFCCSSTP